MMLNLSSSPSQLSASSHVWQDQQSPLHALQLFPFNNHESCPFLCPHTYNKPQRRSRASCSNMTQQGRSPAVHLQSCIIHPTTASNHENMRTLLEFDAFRTII